MELALETTSRRKDVTLIGPQHRRMTPHGEVLDLRHTKNDSNAFIPLTDELRAAIDACPTKHLCTPNTARGARRRRSAAISGNGATLRACRGTAPFTDCAKAVCGAARKLK
jgi:hypothetical protein